MNIKNLFLSSLLFLSTATFANEHMNEVAGEQEEAEGKFYVAAKPFMTMGNNVKDEEGAEISGGTGYGFGIDLGYRIAYGFALEVDATYAFNSVSKTSEEEGNVDINANYYTSSVDLAYLYHVTHHIGVFGKVGYEYEIEIRDDLDSNENATGFVGAVGMEYGINETYGLLLEYEATTIDSPRGNTLFVGLNFNF